MTCPQGPRSQVTCEWRFTIFDLAALFTAVLRHASEGNRLVMGPLGVAASETVSKPLTQVWFGRAAAPYHSSPSGRLCPVGCHDGPPRGPREREPGAGSRAPEGAGPIADVLRQNRLVPGEHCPTHPAGRNNEPQPQ